MTRARDPSLVHAIDLVAPLLDRDLATAAEAALAVAAEVAGADLAGFVLLRNGRLRVESWVGTEGALRETLRNAALEAGSGASGTPPRPDATCPAVPSPPSSPLHVAVVETRENLLMVLGLAWNGGRPNDLRGTAILRAETIARIVAGRWIQARALEEVRSERAQQERWFKTMDRQLRVLDRERQKFVAVVNQSDTFMFVVVPSFEIVWVNRAVSRHCETGDIDAGRVSTLDQAWKCLAIVVAPAGSAACPVARALRTNQVVHEELRRAHRDGVQHVYLTFLPIQGSDGKAAEVLVMIQDLSGLEVVRRLEARYRRLFEHSPDGMLMIDPADGRILLANDAAAGLTGYTRDRLPELGAAALHGDRWPDVQGLCRRALEGHDRLSMEGDMATARGMAITVNLTAVHLELDGQSVALVQYRDITERKRLERELRHSHKMEAIGTLAGGVAHDFNNLLTVILGKSELLANRLTDDPGVRGLAETIQKAARRGSLLTRKLLSFSRKDIVRAEQIDLVAVVRDLAPLLDTLAAERVRLDVRLPPEPCPVQADRSQIEQVLMNLAVNGRDAMPDGGCLHISLRVEPGVATNRSTRVPLDAGESPAGGVRRVVLEVRDEGVGIDEMMRSHIFEPFFTTKALGEGTGLGLSTVYSIVKDCGGRIEVTSTPGQGSTFRVLLPRVEAEAVDEAAEGGAEAETLPGSERVLLVEDEDDLREMAREALEIGGYAVVPAASGEEALDLYESESGAFQLLLTDVVMPGISGGELAVRIRAADPGIGVLYMSGYNDDAIVRHGVSRDEASFLPKPFTLAQLTGKVRELLDERAA